jgi:hypothetical protein
METELSRLLSRLPTPFAVAATIVLAVLWLLPMLDTVWRRRRLENAKLEREKDSMLPAGDMALIEGWICNGAKP